MLFCARRTYGFALLALLILTFPNLALADTPVIVYDNSTTPTHSLDAEGIVLDGFFPFNFYVELSQDDTQDAPPPEPMGNEIVLAGTEREIVRFDMILSSNEPTTLDNLTLTLHDEHKQSDHLPGFPLVGPALWSGTLHDVFVDGVTVVTFDVPNVVVPDMFLWSAGTDDLTKKAGLATYDPATVGLNPAMGPPFFDDPVDYFYSYTPDYIYEWGTFSFNNDPEANFGATVWAVPEPATLSLLLLGGVSLCPRKKRR